MITDPSWETVSMFLRTGVSKRHLSGDEYQLSPLLEGDVSGADDEVFIVGVSDPGQGLHAARDNDHA